MRYLALIFVVVLGSCARTSQPPVQQDNACSILDQRSGWLNALQKAEANWGAPVHVQMAIIWKESSFRARARTQRIYFLGSIPTGRISSAFGYSQALDGTWDDYREQTSSRGAKRSNFRDATDFIGWYMQNSNRRNGIAMDDAYNQYLAYHEGQAGYSRGSYREKDWLVGVAGQVRNQAARYEAQLQYCT